MMRVIDGARALDGANNTPDIKQANYAGATTTNGTGASMEDFDELLVVASSGAVGAAGVVITVQESNESAANYTNISSALLNFVDADDNKVKFMSVAWTHPDRKKYYRLQSITGANTAEHGAYALRVRNRRLRTTDTNFVLA